jgi:lysophospholipase L1-like esterase
MPMTTFTHSLRRVVAGTRGVAQPAFALAAWIAAAALLGAACGGSSSDTSTSGTKPAKTAVWNITALGDSDTTGSGDPTGVGWVGAYARLIHERLGVNVRVTNLAVDGKTSDQLLAELRDDPTTRRDVAHAAIVLIGIGGADLNAGDDALQAGRCNGKACYAPILRTFARNFDAIAAQVQALHHTPTLVRAISIPNAYPGAGSVIPPFITAGISLYEATAERKIVCDTMTNHGGRCIDVVRALNGATQTEDAYKAGLMNKEQCCYPSTKGQQLMAELLYKTGVAPLHPSGA